MSAEQLPDGLRRDLHVLARTGHVLISCDYDGTLAPIVDDPARAWPRADSVAALDALAALAGTTAAVISGRARHDLAALAGFGPDVVLVGSHGAEFDAGFDRDLRPDERHLLETLRAELERLTSNADGALLEAKPAGLAVHVRRADPATAQRVLDEVAAGPARWDGIAVTEGKAVVELAVVDADKGSALQTLRGRVGADAVAFIGDDVTDERAFARLAGADVGIKVGPGRSRAEHRVGSPEDVTTVLQVLLEARRRAVRA